MEMCYLSVDDPELVPEAAPLSAVGVDLLEVDREAAREGGLKQRLSKVILCFQQQQQLE